MRFNTILSRLFYFVCFILKLTSLHGQDIFSEKIVSRLSPRPVTVKGVAAIQISLNGEWNFHIKGNPIKRKIAVPGEWEMQGLKVYEGETAVYEKMFAIPKDWIGKRIKLRFDGVSSFGKIKINGNVVCTHEGGFVPFETDITSFIKDVNTLEVEVQAMTISDRLGCISQYAEHTVGGILRKVTLFVLPEINIKSLFISTVFDERFENAILNIDVSLSDLKSDDASIKLNHILKNSKGEIVARKKFNTDGLHQMTIIKPGHWNPEQPVLYQLITELIVNNEIKQINKQAVGFRQITTKENQEFINGMPIKLRGFNRHSVHPLTGRSINPRLEREDALLFRNANCNFIRTSHYPPSEEFLQAADQLGMLVESEAAICWIGHAAAPIWKLWDYKDEKYLPHFIKANLDNIIAGRNHPSVIMWSMANESYWSEQWQQVYNICKKFDPTRIIVFHDQCEGTYNNKGSKADIANYHYPNVEDIGRISKMGRPLLLGEYAHISCYNRRELLTDPGIRSAYGKPLAMLYDSIYYFKGCLGGAIWSGIDDIFHLPDGRIVGYGPWGLIDGWRRQKPEYYGVKKAYSPVVIKNVDQLKIVDNKLILELENRYNFIDLSKLQIECRVDGKMVHLKSSIAPNSSGTLRIPILNTKRVELTFIDPRGFIANQEVITLQTKNLAEPSRKVKLSVRENEAVYIIKQGNTIYEISKTTGIMNRAIKNGETVITRGPIFCIAPLNKDDGGKPGIGSQSYQNNIYPLKSYSWLQLFAKNMQVRQLPEGIKIDMDVHFHFNASGKQSFLFKPGGEVLVQYQVKFSGPDSMPRQYGLLMQLANSFTRLSWNRKGEFTNYPDSDISRMQGHSTLSANHSEEVELWGRKPHEIWKDDANEFGSNDFRSTKNQITLFSLANGKSKIKVISDGTQSARAWLQDKRMQLLVADYSNAGAELFYRSPYTDDRIVFKKNQVIEGRLLFMIE